VELRLEFAGAHRAGEEDWKARRFAPVQQETEFISCLKVDQQWCDTRRFKKEDAGGDVNN
jgi:hypothetical protein